jgi:hypothetical protein
MKWYYHAYLQIALTLWVMSIILIASNEAPDYRDVGLSYFIAAMIGAYARKEAEK